MPKRDSKSSRKTFGVSTQSEINFLGDRARQKIKIYERTACRSHMASFHKINNRNNQQEQLSISQITDSLNQLRNTVRSEKSRSVVINNRLKYLETDRQRKSQMVQIAKSKYHRMIEARQQNFMEKSELQKERQNLLKQRFQEVSQKASRVKSERMKSSISSKQWRQKNFGQAQEVKQKRIINQRLIKQRQKNQVKRNQQKKIRIQQQQSKSKQKIVALHNQRIQSGKKMHQLKLFDVYCDGQIQKRKNTRLYKSFQRQSNKLHQDHDKMKKQLEEYQHFLGLKRVKKPQKQSNFYVTNC